MSGVVLICDITQNALFYFPAPQVQVVGSSVRGFWISFLGSSSENSHEPFALAGRSSS